MLKKEEEATALENFGFLRDMFKNYLSAKVHQDTKINWLLGISGLIMSFLTSYVVTQSISGELNTGVFIIFISAFATFFLCLLNLDFPNFFLSKKHQEGNLMFPKDILGKSQNQLFRELKELDSYDKILKQYANNFVNLAERNIYPKNKLFVLSRNILLIGLLLGTILMIIQFFF